MLTHLALKHFYIAGKTPVDQLLDITNYDNFYPDALERALDKITAILQEWNHLVDFETKARILADIAYDDLAKEREADLKAYIDGIASSIIGQPVVGLPAHFVIDGEKSQKEINNQTIRTIKSVSDLINIRNPRNGQVVFVETIQLIIHMMARHGKLQVKLKFLMMESFKFYQTVFGKQKTHPTTISALK